MLRVCPQNIQSRMSKNIMFDRKNRILRFETLNDGELVFPFTWLRDNCQCKECFHPQSEARLIICKEFNVNEELVGANYADDNLRVAWESGHVSNFPLTWLKTRNFSKAVQEQYLVEHYRLPKKIFSKNAFKEIFKTFDFHKILDTDEGKNN